MLPCHEAAIVLVEDEPRIVKEVERRLDHPPLVRDGQAHPVSHDSVPTL